MENIIYEAGYLMTYALSELDAQKEVNPIYFHIDLEYQRKTKEIRGNSLSETIPKAIKKLQKNAKKTLSNLIIIPAELENSFGKRESAIVAMIFDNINEKSLTITIPYSFEDDKLTIKEYEVIDSDNLDRKEFIYLEAIFNRGLLNFEQGSYIWKERFRGKKSKHIFTPNN
jgi:hypothetical protein